MSEPCACCWALWIKFVLAEELTVTKECAKAHILKVDDVRQYWQGEDPFPTNPDPNLPELELEDIQLKVYNLESGTPELGAYQFSGKAGNIGLACLDESNPNDLRYRVVRLECGPCKAVPVSQHMTVCEPASEGDPNKKALRRKLYLLWLGRLGDDWSDAPESIQAIVSQRLEEGESPCCLAAIPEPEFIETDDLDCCGCDKKEIYYSGPPAAPIPFDDSGPVVIEIDNPIIDEPGDPPKLTATPANTIFFSIDGVAKWEGTFTVTPTAPPTGANKARIHWLYGPWPNETPVEIESYDLNIVPDDCGDGSASASLSGYVPVVNGSHVYATIEQVCGPDSLELTSSRIAVTPYSVAKVYTPQTDLTAVFVPDSSPGDDQTSVGGSNTITFIDSGVAGMGRGTGHVSSDAWRISNLGNQFFTPDTEPILDTRQAWTILFWANLFGTMTTIEVIHQGRVALPEGRPTANYAFNRRLDVRFSAGNWSSTVYAYEEIDDNNYNDHSIAAQSAAVAGWHLVAVRWNGSVLDLFIDGSVADSASMNPNGTVYPITGGTLSTNVAMAGGGSFGSSALIDGLAIYQRALSAAEIAQHYNGGAGLPWPF